MLDAAYCGLCGQKCVARKGKWEVGMQLSLARRSATSYLLSLTILAVLTGWPAGQAPLSVVAPARARGGRAVLLVLT